jgi:predicted transcriptional regulator
MRYKRTIEWAFARNNNKFMTVFEIAKETGLGLRKVEYTIRDFPEQFVSGFFGNERKYKLAYDIPIQQEKQTVIGLENFIRAVSYDYIVLNGKVTTSEMAAYLGTVKRTVAMYLMRDHRLVCEDNVWSIR